SQIVDSRFRTRFGVLSEPQEVVAGVFLQRFDTSEKVCDSVLQGATVWEIETSSSEEEVQIVERPAAKARLHLGNIIGIVIFCCATGKTKWNTSVESSCKAISEGNRENLVLDRSRTEGTWNDKFPEDSITFLNRLKGAAEETWGHRGSDIKALEDFRNKFDFIWQALEVSDRPSDSSLRMHNLQMSKLPLLKAKVQVQPCSGQDVSRTHAPHQVNQEFLLDTGAGRNLISFRTMPEEFKEHVIDAPERRETHEDEPMRRPDDLPRFRTLLQEDRMAKEASARGISVPDTPAPDTPVGAPRTPAMPSAEQGVSRTCAPHPQNSLEVEAFFASCHAAPGEQDHGSIHLLIDRKDWHKHEGYLDAIKKERDGVLENGTWNYDEVVPRDELMKRKEHINIGAGLFLEALPMQELLET
ncbi:unnamed protein product, partial [Cladocopium goreaui]